jgi:SagB-type dehydrogenase family enzyme
MKKTEQRSLIMKSVLTVIACVLLSTVLYAADANAPRPAQPAEPAPTAQIVLGEPNITGTLSVEEAIAEQKRTASFSTHPLEIAKLRQLAWAGQTIIDAVGKAQPPENSVIPIDLYFCLSSGVYRYNPAASTLESLGSADVRSMLADAARNETAIKDAPCTIIIAASANPSGTVTREQMRSIMMLDAGKISQNIQLEAQSLGLGTLGVGSFDIVKVKRLAKVAQQQEPAYIVAAGYPAGITPDEAARRLQPSALLIVSGSDTPNELADIMDVLRAAGIKITIAQSGPSRVRIEWYQRSIQPDMSVQNVVPSDYDAVIVIGGSGDPMFTRYPVSLNIIRQAVRNGAVVGASGAATPILSNAGVLRGVRYTGDQRQLMNSGGTYTGQLVESDQGIVTALNPQQSSFFARAIIAALRAKTFPQLQSEPAVPPNQPPPAPSN